MSPLSDSARALARARDFERVSRIDEALGADCVDALLPDTLLDVACELLSPSFAAATDRVTRLPAPMLDAEAANELPLLAATSHSFVALRSGRASARDRTWSTLVEPASGELACDLEKRADADRNRGSRARKYPRRRPKLLASRDGRCTLASSLLALALADEVTVGAGVGCLLIVVAVDAVVDDAIKVDGRADCRAASDGSCCRCC